MSVDCTDLEVVEPYPYCRVWSKKWYSHKFKGPGVRYEIALCIYDGSIVWVNGPFPCGKYNDCDIFMNLGLKNQLQQYERVEADDGYRAADPLYVRCPGSRLHPQDTVDHRRALRGRHETVNKRIKQYNILRAPFQNGMHKHRMVFQSIIVLTQISFDLGQPLFGVNLSKFH